ncbi:MAG TPA: hypothetical protein VF145_12995, partial [Chitinophagaceae bacterium]
LEFLHLRHTRVTVYGALKMGYIPTLKCLMLSADDDGLIAVEIAQLKILMPGCEILVNGKTM